MPVSRIDNYLDTSFLSTLSDPIEISVQLLKGFNDILSQIALDGTVRLEPGENKQAQTRAVSRSYSHLCGRQYASSERGTIRRLALKVKTKSSV